MKIQPQWSAEEDNSEERGTSLIGKVVYVHCQEPMESLSYALSTAHIIGYDPSKDKKDRQYYTFTALCDGMTLRTSLAKLIALLNAQPYVPIPSSVLHAIMIEKQPLK
jgi:hypothetical protein